MVIVVKISNFGDQQLSTRLTKVLIKNRGLKIKHLQKSQFNICKYSIFRCQYFLLRKVSQYRVDGPFTLRHPATAQLLSWSHFFFPGAIEKRPHLGLVAELAISTARLAEMVMRHGGRI